MVTLRPAFLALPALLALMVSGCIGDTSPPAGTDAADPQPSTGHQPYAGLDRSPIRGLTEQEIMELRSGAGMRLALPAELNGYPGPKHVVELAEELGLSQAQAARMEALRDATMERAREAGRAVLAAHQALDLAFRDGSAHGEALDALLQEVADAEAELRGVHLRAHLDAVSMLTPEQVEEYARLRGYDGSAPASHDGHGAGHGGHGSG